MKKLLLLLMALSAMAAARADDVGDNGDDGPAAAADSCLVVWQKDGSLVQFHLDERPKITYVGDSVIIEAASTVTCAFQAIRKMSYRMENASTAIRQLTAPGPRPFTSTGGTITFQPADRDLRVGLVRLSGTVASNFTIRRGQPASISLDAYPPGVYLMNVNGVTYKIHIR